MRAAMFSRGLTACVVAAWLTLALGACGVSSTIGSTGAPSQSTSSATTKSSAVTPTAAASSTSPGGASGVGLTYPHPSLAEIAPGASTARLQPPQEGSGGAAWRAGTYRVSLAYLTSPTQSLGQSAVVYSATFTMG